MPTEIFSGLSGEGTQSFSAAFYFFRVRVHIDNLGDARPIDLDTVYGRKGQLGFWVPFENASSAFPDGFPAGQYEEGQYWIMYHDISFRKWDSTQPFDPSGFDGFYHHLLPGVVASFQFAY